MKKVYLFLMLCCFSAASYAQTTSLAGRGVFTSTLCSTITNVNPNVSNAVQNFYLVQAGSNANLTQVSFVTTGTYTTTDITNFTLYVNTNSNALVGSTAVASGSISATGPGTQTINLSTPYTLSTGTTAYYFFIVPTLGGSPVAGHTISINSLSASNITVSTGSVSGSAPAAGPITITLLNPSITGSSGGTTCPLGTVNLSATPSVNTVIDWYSAATGGSSLGTVNTYTTPSLASTTTYYAEGTQGATYQFHTLSENSANLASLGAYVYDQRTDLNWISTTSAVTINSVDIYPAAAGNVTLVLANNAGTILQTAPTYTVTSGQISSTVPVTIPLGFNVPAGVVNYRIGGGGVILGGDAYIYRGSLTAYGPYPATMGGLTITGDAASGAGYVGLGSRAYFFNWNVTQTATASPRTSVTATVNPAPTGVTVTASPNPVCNSGNLTLTGTATGAASYSWAGPGGTAISSPTSLSTSVTGVAAGNAGVYTLTATTALSCTATATSAAVTVNPLPSAITGSPLVCAGQNTTLSDAGGGTWTSSNPSNATVGSTTGVVTGVSAGITNIIYTLPTGCFKIFPVTVNQTPPITGATGTCVGNTTTLSDIASGGTWTSSNTLVAPVGSSTGIVSGISIGSATITYTLPPLGCFASQVVNITSAPPSYIVTGGGITCAGGSTIHVGLTNSTVGVSYQVYVGGVPTGTLIPGTGGVLDLGVQSIAGTYTVIANPGTSCATTMSGSVNISTLPAPTAYTISGGGNYCPGSAGPHILLSSSNTGVSYQLRNGAFPSGTPLSGTGASLDFGSISTTGTYTVLATNSSNGCTTTMTGSVTVSVNPLPTAFSVTGGGNTCAGGTGVAVGLSNSTSGVNYQLYRGGVATGAPVAGTNSAITFGNQIFGGIYTVIATNATTGCINNMTGSVTVTVVSLPSVFTVTGGGAYCAGGTGPHIGLAGSSTGVNYQLYNGAGTVGGLVSGTGIALDFGAQNAAGTYTVNATVASTTCSVAMVGSVSVIINPAPGTFVVTGGGSYCAGTGGVHIGLSGSVIGTSYFCYNGSTLAGGASGTGSAIDFGSISPAGTYTVVATTTTTGCSGNMTGNAIITINPLPAIFNVTGGGSYCSGSAAPHVFLSGSANGVNYTLMKGSTPVGVPVAGTGSSLDFGAQAASGTYTITAYNSATGCSSTMSGSVVVTANPLPSAYLVTGGGNYCAGGTGIHVGLGGSNSGISYQLNLAGLPVGSPLAGTGSALDFGLKTASGAYTVTAANATTLCTNTMSGSVSVGILPLPVAYPMTGGGNYCAGGSGQDIGLTNSDLGINYQLYNGSSTAGATIGGSGTTIDFGLQTAAGTYTVLATDGVTGCSNSMTGSGIVGINPLPTVYNVTGGGSYCPTGTGVHIGLNNSNTGINYQLYLGTTPLGSVTPGTGSTVDFGLQTVAGSYTVMAINPATGCTQLMSGSTLVSISALPPVHNVTGGGGFYCAGGIGVHVGLDGSDAGNTYQLYRGGVLSGSPVTGTGVALDFGLITVGGGYTVVATGLSTGCNSNMTGGAVVTVSGLPPSHIITGGGNYCPGAAGVHIGLNGSDPGVNYQLYNGTLASGSPIAGTGPALDFGLLTATGTYTIIATNTVNACTVAMAGTASVGVAALPVVFNVTGSGNYCFGGSGLHVLLSGSNPGVTYKLYNGGTPTATTLSGTGSPLDFGLQIAGNYTIVATSSSTLCSNNMTGIATISISPLPVLFNVTGGGYYCAGGTGVDIQLSGSETGVTYQLSVGGSPAGGSVAGTGSSLDFGLSTVAGIYSVAATNTLTGCIKNMSGTATVAINPLPVAYPVSGGGFYCAIGSGSDISLGGSTSGITYQLYYGTAATGVPAFGTGSALDFGLFSLAGNYTVIAADPTTGCSGYMAGSAIISILPLPAVYTVTGGGAVCTGSAGVDIGLSGSSSGATYQLVQDGVNTGSPVAGTGALIDFGLQTVAATYTIVATNIASGCNNNMSGSAVVTAGTLPTVYTLSGSSTTGYCSGAPGELVYLASSDPGVSYQLLRGATAAEAPVMGTGGLLSFGYQSVVGLYTVEATNSGTGCNSAMAGGISVFINPLPSVYNVTGGGGYCSGGSGAHIGISGSATGINYQLYQSGLPIGPFVPGTGTALDMGVQTLTGSYTVYAVNPLTGCGANMSGSSIINVLPAPLAYTVTGGGNFCAGGSGLSVGLSGSVTGVTYQLSRDGTPSGSPLAGTGLPLNYGIHSLSGYYTITATITATGCSGSMAGGVIINPVPLPVPHNVNGTGSYCAGGAGLNVGLDASSTGVTYKLYNGSTLVGSPVSGTGFGISFGPQTASGSYTVIGIDNSTTCNSEMVGSALITINALPDVFSVTGGGNYCAGGPGDHIGLASSVPGINYSLYYGVANINTITGTGTILDFGLQTGAGGYTIKATNPATSCNQMMAGNAIIDTITLVTPSVTISTGSGDSLCSGAYTTFTAIGTNGGITPTYQWTINGINTGMGMTYSYYPANGDVVNVTLNSTAACATPAAASNSATITVLPKEVPAVMISADPGVEVCRGTSVVLTATASYGGASPSYIWKKGSSVIGAGSTLSFIPLNGDVITCKMTSNYLCRLANTATSAPVNMIVDTPSAPVVSIAAYPGLSISEGQLLTFEATVTNAGPAPVYQWTVNNVAITGATGPEFSGNNFGNGDLIACNVLSSGGCAGVHGGAEVTIHVSNVGVKNIINNQADIRVIPNPSNGSFVVTGTTGSDNEVSLEVTDMTGQVVYKSAIMPKNGEINERVQLANSVANGMYILNMRSEKDNKVFHVVIER